MPIKIGSFSWERINHFPFISHRKNLFGIRPVWYKSKDLERIKDVYRGRAIAQAVSRRLPTAEARVQTVVWSCGIL
jgi:hypothetical protein